jgi:hypothetical protein
MWLLLEGIGAKKIEGSEGASTWRALTIAVGKRRAIVKWGCSSGVTSASASSTPRPVAAISKPKPEAKPAAASKPYSIWIDDDGRDYCGGW